MSVRARSDINGQPGPFSEWLCTSADPFDVGAEGYVPVEYRLGALVPGAAIEDDTTSPLNECVVDLAGELYGYLCVSAGHLSGSVDSLANATTDSDRVFWLGDAGERPVADYDPVTFSPEVAVSETRNGSVFEAGDPVEFVYTATGVGSDPTRNAGLSVTVPSGFEADSTPSGCVLVGLTFRCLLGDLARGDEAVVRLVGTALEALSASDFVVESLGVDEVESQIPWKIALRSDQSQPALGQTVELIGTVESQLFDLDDLRVAFSIPGGLDVVAVSDRCLNVGGTRVECVIENVGAGDFEVVAFSVSVNANSVIRFGAAQGESVVELPGDYYLNPTPPQGVACPPGQCSTGRAWGDPHLITFDGVAYDFQIVGESIYARSGDDLMVQMRTAPWRGSNRVSVISGIAAQVGSQRVAVYTDRITLDGVDVPAVNGVTDLGGGASLTIFGSDISVAWPGAGDRPQLDVEQRPDHLNVDLGVPQAMTGALEGLLGNGDGDPTNEFAERDGTLFEFPISSASLYRPFADSWRLTDGESLFDYAPGETTATFTDLSFPDVVLRVEDLDPAARARAEAACRALGITDVILIRSCVIDYVITGDIGLAGAALNVEPPILAADGTLSSDVVLGDDPLRYYRFGEDDAVSMDSAGSGYELTIDGDVTRSVGPILNEPDLALVSTNAAPMATASEAGLPLAGTERTLEAWIKPASGTTSRTVVGYGSLALQHRTSSGNSFIELRDAGSLLATWGVGRLIDGGGWHHVALAFENGEASLFMNGQLHSTQPAALATTAGSELVLGVVGSVDETAIYDRALSHAEIFQHWHIALNPDGQPCQSVPEAGYAALVMESNPSAYFRFDDVETAGQQRLAPDTSAWCRTALLAGNSTETLGVAGSGIAAPSMSSYSGGLPSGGEARAVEVWLNGSSSGRVVEWGGFEVRVGSRTRNGQPVSWVSLKQDGVDVAYWEFTYRFSDDGEFHHLVFNFDGTDAEFFFDGFSQGTQPATIETTGLGNLTSSSNGLIDELVVYPGVLSAGLVQEHWLAGGGVSQVDLGCGSVPSDAYGVLVMDSTPDLFYRFDETATVVGERVILDASGGCRWGLLEDRIDTGVDGFVGETFSDWGVIRGNSDGLASGGEARAVEVWLNGSSSGRVVEWGGFEVRVGSRTRNGQPVSWVSLKQDGVDVAYWEFTYRFSDDGEFHHLVFNFDGTDAEFFFDGFSQGTQPAVIDTGDADLYIAPGGNIIDELVVYPGVLSAGLVQEHWLAGGGVSQVDLGCGSVPSDAYGVLVMDSTPDLFYRFDETATVVGERVILDASGGCRWGLLEDRIDTGVAGFVGETFSDWGVIRANSDGLASGGEARAVEVWLNGSSSGRVVEWGGFEVRVGSRTRNGQPVSWVSLKQDGVDVAYWEFTYRFSDDGEFHHLVFNFDGTDAEFFFDGFSQGTQPATIGTGDTDLYIAPGSNIIDELVVYPDVLTQTEITSRAEFEPTGTGGAP